MFNNMYLDYLGLEYNYFDVVVCVVEIGHNQNRMQVGIL